MTSLQSVWWNLIILCLLLIYSIARCDSNKKKEKKKNHQQRDKLCHAGTKAPSHINTQSLSLVSCLCSCFSFISLLKGTQEGWGREEEEETSCSCTLRYSLPRSSVLLVVFVSDNESDDDGDDARDNWGGSRGVKGNLKNPPELFFFPCLKSRRRPGCVQWLARFPTPIRIMIWPSDSNILVIKNTRTHTHTHTHT